MKKTEIKSEAEITLDQTAAQLKIITADKRTVQVGYESTEESIVHPDGKIHKYEIHKFILPESNEENRIGEIAIDITDRKRMEEVVNRANKELAFQYVEKQERADELVIANKELAFQNEDKHKRADELIIANKELFFQNEEKQKRADELVIANKELAFQNEEKQKRADELIIANKELVFQNEEKQKRADELIIANKELVFQNEEKQKRADELIIANKELAFQNEEKQKRADELVIANKELVFQNEEKQKRADELIIANKELAFQNEEKHKRADELILANKELAFQNEEKQKRSDELVIAIKELAFQNEEKHKRADELRESEVRYNAAAAKNESAIKWQATFDGIQAIIFMIDLNGGILQANKAAENFFGKPQEKITGRFCYELVHETECFEGNCPFSKAKVSNKRETKNLLINEKWYSVVIDPIFDKDNKISSAIHIMIDITERKQAELLIQQQNHQLKEVNATKDKLFSIIAHDLRSPFTGLLGLTEMMAEDSAEYTSLEVTKFLSSLHLSISNVYKLLVNLLEWAQLQTGSISFSPAEYSLFNTFLDCEKSIKENAISKEISVVNEIPDAMKIFADDDMIKSLLRNLLNNALKFTNRGGKIVAKARETADGMIEVSIADTGIGIPENIIPRLFIVGEDVGSKGTEQEASTGLGLLLCKDFVKIHGGKIWVESEIGKGSTFYFTLPKNNRD